jgi:flagellar basal-body rod modification protein FlgD
MQVFANQILPQEMAAAQNSDGSGNGATSSATITASDFLQLLVTEMQNQDPTTQTDPNEYIDQLVQVNSLEQLVQINQDLTNSATTNSDANSGSGSSAANGAKIEPYTPTATSGNLSTPIPGDTANAALRVASALGGEKDRTDAFSSSGAGTTGANAFDAIAAAMRTRRTAISTTTLNPAR